MRYHISTFILVSAVCAATTTLRASDIAFGPGLPSSAASDFILGGTLDRAYAFNAPNPLHINGIDFLPFDGNPFGDTTTIEGRYDEYKGDGQTGDYLTLLQNGVFHDGDVRSISFTGLSPGGAYTMEIVASGLRARTDCCSAGAGYTNLFVYNRPGAVPGTTHWEADDAGSQHMYGRFTAGGSGNLTVYFNPASAAPLNQTNSIQLHGIVLSYVPAPEPTSLALLGLAGIGLTMLSRRGGT